MHAMERHTIWEVTKESTLMGYKEIPVRFGNDTFSVKIDGILNLNFLDSPYPFLEKYRLYLSLKSFESWVKLQRNHQVIKEIQRGTYNEEKFRDFGEPSVKELKALENNQKKEKLAPKNNQKNEKLNPNNNSRKVIKKKR